MDIVAGNGQREYKTKVFAFQIALILLSTYLPYSYEGNSRLDYAL